MGTKRAFSPSLALWFVCGFQRVRVHSLMKPTNSVEQLIVYKPECSVV